MDIRNYMISSPKKAGSKINTNPDKKMKLVVDSNGTNYEGTDYMVCSICIKVFKTIEKYVLHIEDHETKSGIKNIPIMKVFKQVPADEASNKRIEEPQIISTPPTISSTVIENYTDPDSNAQALVKLGLPETLGVTIKNLSTTIKTLDTRINLQGVNNITMTTNEFRRAITSMSDNIRDQLLRRIRQSPYFSLHLAEFLDIKNFMVLIVTIRYKFETRIQDEILFIQQLKGTNADEIYLATSNFMNIHQLDWEKCVGICMDEVRAQHEPLKYFTEYINNSELAPYLTSTFSRRASFIIKHLPDILVETLRDAVEIVNILKRDIAFKFENDIDDGYQQIFYHTDQYWLSYCRLFSRLLEMREQCKEMPEISSFKDKMNDTNWLHKLAYLANIFDCFSRLNIDLQNEQYSTFHIYDKFTFMIDVLKMFKTEIELDDYTQFPILQGLMTIECHKNINPDVKSAILEHLQSLQKFMIHFLPIAGWEIKICSWVRNPFGVHPDKMPPILSADEKEMLVNLRKDGFIAATFDEKKLEYFWALAEKKYPDLGIKAMKYLLIFKDSQLSEMAFAALVDIRTKFLTSSEYEEAYIRIKLSNIEPESGKILETTDN